MDKLQQGPEDEYSTLEDAEVSMEPQVTPETSPNPSSRTSNTRCVHQRLIDDILTRDGKRTGKVRCLECGTIFDDPYHGSK